MKFISKWCDIDNNTKGQSKKSQCVAADDVELIRSASVKHQNWNTAVLSNSTHSIDQNIITVLHSEMTRTSTNTQNVSTQHDNNWKTVSPPDKITRRSNSTHENPHVHYLQTSKEK